MTHPAVAARRARQARRCALLVLVGVALLTGWWDVWVGGLQQWSAGFQVAV